MGKAYRISGDEKYAKEWAYQYMDWIKKNPLTTVEEEEYELVSAGEVKGMLRMYALHGVRWK